MSMAVDHARAVRHRLWNPVNGRRSSELDVVPDYVVRRQRIAQALSRSRYPQMTAGESRRERESGFIETFNAEFIGLSLPSISRIVCDYYDLTREQVAAQRKILEVVRPRQIIMYLAKEHIHGLSLPSIGRQIGGMDHTTVLHAVRKIKQLMVTDLRLAAEVEYFERKLRCYRP